MQNISHFRSVSKLSRNDFFQHQNQFSELEVFSFLNNCFLFLTIFFHFPTLVSKLFLQFSKFEFVWIVGVFSTLPICSWFQSVVQKIQDFFQITKNFFWKNEFFNLFIAFSNFIGCFHFGGISFTFWKFFHVLNSVFISSCFCFFFTGVFVNFQITVLFFFYFGLHFADFSTYFNNFFKLNSFNPFELLFVKILFCLSFRENFSPILQCSFRFPDDCFKSFNPLFQSFSIKSFPVFSNFRHFFDFSFLVSCTLQEKFFKVLLTFFKHCFQFFS